MKTLIACSLALLASTAPAQEEPILVSPADVQWGEGSPALPPGSKMSLLRGDPKQAGPFTLRALLPANYKIPPHFHPDTETVTVLSGTFYASMGDTFDAAKCKAMPAGSYLALPGKSPHFVYTKEETIIQVTAMGPWSLTYVNPADDPRKAK